MCVQFKAFVCSHLMSVSFALFQQCNDKSLSHKKLLLCSLQSYLNKTILGSSLLLQFSQQLAILLMLSSLFDGNQCPASYTRKLQHTVGQIGAVISSLSENDKLATQIVYLKWAEKLN